MKSLITIGLVSLSGALATAAGANFDSLGSNEGVVKRAQALSSSQKVQIVQKRAVDRRNRFEFGVNYGGVSGGNSYMNTQPISGTLDFHFNPKIAVGVRYSHFANQLTREGENQFESARRAKAAGQLDFSVPEIDFPTSSVMATASVFPMYGKLNFFDLTVVQFDFYAIGGYGMMTLKSGNSETWTAGGGVGFWWNQHISSRFEVRHQAYLDRVQTGTRDVGMLIGTLGIGIIL